MKQMIRISTQPIEPTHNAEQFDIGVVGDGGLAHYIQAFRCALVAAGFHGETAQALDTRTIHDD